MMCVFWVLCFLLTHGVWCCELCGCYATGGACAHRNASAEVDAVAERGFAGTSFAGFDTATGQGPGQALQLHGGAPGWQGDACCEAGRRTGPRQALFAFSLFSVLFGSVDTAHFESASLELVLHSSKVNHHNMSPEQLIWFEMHARTKY